MFFCQSVNELNLGLSTFLIGGGLKENELNNAGEKYHKMLIKLAPLFGQGK